MPKFRENEIQNSLLNIYAPCRPLCVWETASLRDNVRKTFRGNKFSTTGCIANQKF